MTEMSKKILDLLTEKQLSYGELSRMTGIPRSMLQRYATGTTEKIPIDRLQLISKALGVDSFSLADWDTATEMICNDINSHEDEENYIALCEYAKQLTPEQRRKLLEMAKIMFPEEPAQ